MELPDDWECLQFSKEAKAGRIGFADRYQFRMEFSWQIISGRPDMKRLIGDYIAKVKTEAVDEDDPEPVARNVGPWHGLKSGKRGETLNTRFSRYFPTQSCLAEAVFLWPDSLDAGVERKILDSVAEERQTLPNFKRWKAFGMDLLASGDLVLQKVGVDPAYAQMAFSPSHDSRKEERFERLGMVENWLKGTVKEWLKRRLPSDMDVAAEGKDTVNGHDIESFSGTSYYNGLAKILGRKDYYQASAWICPRDGRLYFARVSHPDSPQSGSEKRLAGGRLSCCGDLGLGT
jgi:hypothetical protein